MPPDDIFIRSMESHLEWPIALTRAWLHEQADKSKAFDSKLQDWMASQDWTFVRNDSQEWFAALHRSASSLAYLLMNRLIFYKALYDRFEDLPRLEIRASARKAAEVYANLQDLFEKAVQRSGDYEPLFYPYERDWASTLVFEAPGAITAWKGVLRAIGAVDFRQVSSDVLGTIFQRLIGPEERHRYGQHFTGDDIVDLINAFCIRSADAKIIDPACGSGSFLVRAYYRKKALNPKKSHLELLSELFGCDISLYPAHLATLNLAAREINEEANYPRIARRNFLQFDPAHDFCKLPSGRGHSAVSVKVPPLDAVVANPPYVRQEKIDKKEKEFTKKTLESLWPGLHISGRSDLHCYFWPASARLLKEGGLFGFLTSSSWLDVEYGFALQAWILQHFQILAIMETNVEPWFPDARVKTCATILRRCENRSERESALVKFVQFRKPLASLIGIPPGENEEKRQQAVQNLRERIEVASTSTADEDMRIVVKPQSELWDEGVRAAEILGSTQLLTGSDEDDSEAEEGVSDGSEISEPETLTLINGSYAAGKWGRYVRAPDFYFELMREFGDKFTPLASVAQVRRGITSGCDAFFMPHDISSDALEEFESFREFKRQYGVDRDKVEDGTLKIVKAGDGSVHPIESEFPSFEIHSLMKIDRPVVRDKDLDRCVLLVGDPISKLKGTHVATYLEYGQSHSFASTKSKPVLLPKRSTCKAREPWYDLTGLVKPGIAMWPKSQQYRHIAPANPLSLICNCNLYDIAAPDLSGTEQNALVAILNSTIVAFMKTFYGRFAGTEGNLKTEVVDVNLLEVPIPKGISGKVLKRLNAAFQQMQSRSVGRLVEEQLMDCHSPDRAKRIAETPVLLSEELRQPDRWALDDAVFELLGVDNPAERKTLVERLHHETALHFRQIRVVEIQKMEQRKKTGSRKFSADELAADLWDAAEIADLTPVKEWLAKQPNAIAAVSIPNSSPAHLSAHAKMFDNETVYFGKERKDHVTCRFREEAELIKLLADIGVHGTVHVPGVARECESLHKQLEGRIATARSRFEELAQTRTSLADKQTEIVDLLLHWFVLGRSLPVPADGIDT